MTQEPAPVPDYKTLDLIRSGRLLIIQMNRPEVMNAVNLDLHEELAEVFTFAERDEHSDVVVITGTGKGFCAGGDIDHILRNAKDRMLFDAEVRAAKRIIFSILDMEKPLICCMNGHAMGLGATMALFSDVVFASDKAKIADPHVLVGLVAGDGGAIIWPHLVGLARAKEFLLTGETLTAQRAAEIGLINHCVPADELEETVYKFCERLLNGSQRAIRWTKVLLNQELKRVTHSLLDTGLAYEALTNGSPDHFEAIAAMQEKRAPKFGQGK